MHISHITSGEYFILDLDLMSGESCADLADFPLENFAGVGANLNGTPAVCGGSSSGYLQTCYKFTDTVWQTFATMKERVPNYIHQFINK